MGETILLGKGGQMLPIPRAVLEHHAAQALEHSQDRLSFMTQAHHQVRYYVVRELPRSGKPIEPDTIVQALRLPLEQVRGILEELERKLFFLVRNAGGAVCWAFPVAVEPTPHRLHFSSGEQLYAA